MMNKAFKNCLLLLLLMMLPFKIMAHEIRPAYLQIDQIEAKRYQVLWKIPRMGDMSLRIYPQFASSFELKQLDAGKPMANSILLHYNLTGSEPLAGTKIYIENLHKTLVDVLVNVTYLNGEKVTLMLQPDNTSAVLPGETSTWSVVKTYTILGVEHILFGFDHLLFVLALIIITVGFKKIVKTITAFTIAHSITLSMAVLGFANLPGPPVEAIIALSIVFLAVEVIKTIQGKQTLTSKKPWLVAFIFGLLHGFGFAGALGEIGIPQSEIPIALAFFNIGVELGQIAFVIVVLAGILLLKRYKNWSVFIRKVPTYAIGTLAAFWFIERFIGFWY